MNNELANSIKVLIVDDYEYNIMGLRAILELIKNIERVDEVHNGKDAVDLVKKIHYENLNYLKYDLILMDV